MITIFFIPLLEGVDIADMFFQQEGATCHTARDTTNLLRETFGDRIISRNGPQNWPPRSSDLTPFDYFLWGYVKSKVYENKPETLKELEANIRRVIEDITPDLLHRVIENWSSRLEHLRVSCRGHMREIILKK